MAKKHAVRKARSIAKSNGTFLEVIGVEPKQLGVRDAVQPPLLFRPDPLEEQCRQDYLMLLAEENGMTGARELASLLGVSIRSLLKSDIRALRAFIGGRLSPSSPFIVFDSWGYSDEKTLPPHRGTARACPHCRRDGDPVSDDINFPLTVKCQKHHLLLVEHCSSCGKCITYWHKQRRFCDCGMDLADLPAMPAPAWVDLFYCIFAPWRFARTDWYQPGLNEKSEWDAAGLLFYFITNTTGDLALDSKHRCKRRITEAEYPHVEALVSNWPHRFVSRCYELKRRERNFRVDRLMATADAHGLTLLKSAMAIARAQWECTCFVSNGYPDTAELRLRRPRPGDGVMPLGPFDRKVFPRFAQVGKLREARVARAGPSAGLPTKQRGATDHAQAKRLAQLSAGTISIQGAAKRLRCDVYQVLALVYCRFLPARIMPLGVTELRLRPADIDTFWDQVVTKAKKDARWLPGDPEYLVRLCDIKVDRASPTHSSSWIKAIEAVLEGKLPVYIAARTEFGFSGLAVAERTLKRVMRRAGCE